MNINPDPLSRRESTRPPSQQERAAMRATRDRVRTDEVSRRDVAQARIDAARAEAQQQNKDRIEISTQARRRAEASQADGATRRETITRLKAAYKDGSLGIESRRRAAAERMLGSDQG